MTKTLMRMMFQYILWLLNVLYERKTSSEDDSFPCGSAILKWRCLWLWCSSSILLLWTHPPSTHPGSDDSFVEDDEDAYDVPIYFVIATTHQLYQGHIAVVLLSYSMPMHSRGRLKCCIWQQEEWRRRKGHQQTRRCCHGLWTNGCHGANKIMYNNRWY